jgi:phosphoribosylformylglycinamidine synthase
VQRQNPEMQRRCQEVIDRCWQLGEHNPIAFIHDVGAGGLSNALPELVKDGGCGGLFDLRASPATTRHVAAGDLVQRGQERYVLAVDRPTLPRFEAICARERCPVRRGRRGHAEPQLELDDSEFGDARSTCP